MLTLVNVFELSAFGCSLLALQPKNAELKLLLFIMATTIAAEIIAGYYFTRYEDNHIIYNFSIPILIVLYLIQLLKVLHSPKNKTLVKFLLVSYILFAIIDLIYIQNTNQLATYNYIFGALLLSFVVALYFGELIKKPIQVNVLAEPFFWLASGIILMYFPKSILFTFFEYFIYTKSLNSSFGVLFTSVNTVLCFIFYLSICIACTCRWIFRQ